MRDLAFLVLVLLALLACDSNDVDRAYIARIHHDSDAKHQHYYAQIRGEDTDSIEERYSWDRKVLLTIEGDAVRVLGKDEAGYVRESTECGDGKSVELRNMYRVILETCEPRSRAEAVLSWDGREYHREVVRTR